MAIASKISVLVINDVISGNMSAIDEQGGGGHAELESNSILLLRLRVRAFPRSLS